MSHLPATFVQGFHNEDEVKKMRYHPFGKTDINVSHLSLGTGGLSQFYGEFCEAEAIETIQNAIRRGINYIDTAPWYGQGKSETVLGNALKGIPRKSFYIATKVGRYDLEPKTMFDFSRQKTLSSIEESLKRLQLDYVDVIQVHDIEFAPNLDVVLNETLPALEEIVKAGKARYIGITGYPVHTLQECVEKSSVLVSSVLSYARMTLIDNTLADYVPWFMENNLAVINAAGISMGLLTNAGPPKWHPANQELKDICKAAGEYCQEKGVELGRLALHHSLLHEGPCTSTIGMNNKALLESNFDIFYNGLSDKEKSVLKEINEKFFSKLPKNAHWETVEVGEYKKKLIPLV